MQRCTILIVDDEQAQRTVLAGYLRKKQYGVREAGTVAEALRWLERDHCDIILTDFRMPDRTGLDLLRDIKKLHPDGTVVLMTAYGTIEGAVAAMREGAYDYLTKPIDLDELDMLIQRVAERQQLLSENRLLRSQLAQRFSFEGIVSQSAAMESLQNIRTTNHAQLRTFPARSTDWRRNWSSRLCVYRMATSREPQPSSASQNGTCGTA